MNDASSAFGRTCEHWSAQPYSAENVEESGCLAALESKRHAAGSLLPAEQTVRGDDFPSAGGSQPSQMANQ